MDLFLFTDVLLFKQPVLLTFDGTLFTRNRAVNLGDDPDEFQSQCIDLALNLADMFYSRHSDNYSKDTAAYQRMLINKLKRPILTTVACFSPREKQVLLFDDLSAGQRISRADL